MPDDRRPVAAVVTEWRTNSHADVLLARLLEPKAWGHAVPFKLRLASLYVDQVPANDLAQDYCRRHGIPIFPTIAGAVGVDTGGEPVAGVLLVGEHGRYARNSRGQTMYPRRGLFEGIVDAFRLNKRSVPVFCDKHLSYEWLFARWMADLARHEGFPLMAGSSLPVGWRVPAAQTPMGVELEAAFAVGYSDLEAYGFHALETLQCQVERRKGGETGVASVQCLTGETAKARLRPGTVDGDILAALSNGRVQAVPGALPYRALPDDVVFLIRYSDGLEAAVAMVGSMGECFAFGCRRKGETRPETFAIELEQVRPFGHFGHLLRAVEHMIVTGSPPYPIARTLLTTGMLAALMESHHEGGREIPTPHLATLGYSPTDWPYAPGGMGTPA
ncbi:hypothetical protein EP7_004461 [Isosphaeraceae bacterium EP7]